MEAKLNLSYSEFLSWCAYRNKYGSLNMPIRIDRAIARSTAFFGNAMARKRTFEDEDFSPYDKRIRENMSIDMQIDIALSHFPRSQHGK